MDKITVLVTAIAGEEKYLHGCLTSIKNFADEIVVVDMSNGNEISSIAKKFHAKVYKHDFINYVEPVRNFGILKAAGDWILILDPDEEISSTLIKELKIVIENNSADYVRIPRKNIVFGKWIHHARWFPDYNIRFFKKGMVTWSEIIHGVPTTEGRGIDLKDIEENAIIHHHYETIEQFLLRLNRYTTVQAKLKEDYEFKWSELISKPVSEFVSRFFVGEGYKDGVHGLALSLLQAFSEIILYLKIWELSKFKEENISIEKVVGELTKAEKEINFWKYNTLIRNNGGIVNRVKRKFKLQ